MSMPAFVGRAAIFLLRSLCLTFLLLAVLKFSSNDGGWANYLILALVLSPVWLRLTSSGFGSNGA
ncbi:MAG: hypothetical protein OEZ39_18290 [Gammaproteobacteria bacterium]|nr:hypothetical protein [Gammaproteobacteria bacterium]MDH5653817.1 hypothetical protein [Gammaproteobacteria bacterium]